MRLTTYACAIDRFEVCKKPLSFAEDLRNHLQNYIPLIQFGSLMIQRFELLDYGIQKRWCMASQFENLLVLLIC